MYSKGEHHDQRGQVTHVCLEFSSEPASRCSSLTQVPPLNEEAKNQVRGQQEPPEMEMVLFDFCFSYYKAAFKTTLCFTGLKKQSAKLKRSWHQTPWYGTLHGAARRRPTSDLGKHQLLHQRGVSWCLGGRFPPARSAACQLRADCPGAMVNQGRRAADRRGATPPFPGSRGTLGSSSSIMSSSQPSPGNNAPIAPNPGTSLFHLHQNQPRQLVTRATSN